MRTWVILVSDGGDQSWEVVKAEDALSALQKSESLSPDFWEVATVYGCDDGAPSMFESREVAKWVSM